MQLSVSLSSCYSMTPSSALADSPEMPLLPWEDSMHQPQKDRNESCSEVQTGGDGCHVFLARALEADRAKQICGV